MANEIRIKQDAWTTLTMTLAALATGSGRQSTVVTNTNLRWAMILDMKIRSGAVAPTADSSYEIYFGRGDGAGNRDDNAGAADAAFTPLNVALLGTLVVTASANTDFQKFFDTGGLGKIGTEFFIAVRNSSGQSLNGTEGNHRKAYSLYLPEVQ